MTNTLSSHFNLRWELIEASNNYQHLLVAITGDFSNIYIIYVHIYTYIYVVVKTQKNMNYKIQTIEFSYEMENKKISI